jgi:small subunit ribosomal protein S4e
LARMGGTKKIKRSKAPGFWRIPRKNKDFITLPSAGPHPRKECFPLGVLIRDILKLTKTAREADSAIRAGGTLVDSIIRRQPNYPVGLMDVVEFPSLAKVYRMVPKNGIPLVPLEVPTTEKSLKICKIKSKTAVKENRIQYGFHDGKSLIVDGKAELMLGDSCIVQNPSHEIVKTMKMEKDALAMIIRGEKAGKIGKVMEVKEGAFARSRVATLSFDDRTAELPIDLLLVLNQGEPAIKVT